MQHCRLTCAAVMVHNLAKVLLGLFKVDVQANQVLQAKALSWHAALQCSEEGMSCPIISGCMACLLGCIAQGAGSSLPASL